MCKYILYIDETTYIVHWKICMWLSQATLRMQIERDDDKTQLRDSCDKKQWKAATNNAHNLNICLQQKQKKAKAAAAYIFIMYEYFVFFLCFSLV